MRALRWVTAVIAFGLVGAAGVAPAAASAADPLARAGLKASDFGGPINNPYFPLTPGTTLYYAGLLGGEPNTDAFKVTHNTRMILGVKTTVILDRGYINGSLEESTLDYFAQSKDGAVWYFGEYTTQIANGHVTGHVGSWISGKNGALPGIIMEAHPRVGDTYNQENAAPVAEDAGSVMTTTASVSVPFGTFNHHALETKDFSYIDTEIENKYYGKGVGLLRAETRGSKSTDFVNLLIVVAGN
jgi:hypothetical protein